MPFNLLIWSLSDQWVVLRHRLADCITVNLLSCGFYLSLIFAHITQIHFLANRRWFILRLTWVAKSCDSEQIWHHVGLWIPSIFASLLISTVMSESRAIAIVPSSHLCYPLSSADRLGRNCDGECRGPITVYLALSRTSIRPTLTCFLTTGHRNTTVSHFWGPWVSIYVLLLPAMTRDTLTDFGANFY